MPFNRERIRTTRILFVMLGSVVLAFIALDALTGKQQTAGLTASQAILLAAFFGGAWGLPRLDDRACHAAIRAVVGITPLSLALMCVGSGVVTSPAFSFLWSAPVLFGLMFFDDAFVPIVAGAGSFVGCAALFSVAHRPLAESAYWLLVTALCGAIAWMASRSFVRVRRVDQGRAEHSELRARTLLESVPVGILLVGPDGRVEYSNDEAGHILGDGRETLGRDFIWSRPAFIAGTETPYPKDRRPSLRALSGERAECDDYDVLRPDRRRIRLSVVATPIRAVDRRVEGAVVAFADITERCAAVHKLRESNERHALIARAAQDAIWEIDCSTLAIAMSDRARELLRDDVPLELPFERWLPLIHPDDQAAVRTLIDQARASTQERWSLDLRLRRGDGSWAHALINALILRGETGAPARIVGVTRDVTEREELRGRLAQADRLASLGTLAAGVAHEINNPLAFVRSNVRFAIDELRDGSPAPLEMTNALTDALDGIERIGTIVGDLRSFVRTDTEATSSGADLRRAIDMAAAIAAPQLKHRAAFSSSVPDVPNVAGTEQRLTQVFLNLFVNAAQAMPEPSVREPRREIAVTAVSERGGVAIQVRDTGKGMTPEVLHRVFEPFFTTKPEGEGTGLGLFICHGIVSGFGGKMAVTSQPGVGTTFEVWLPFAHPVDTVTSGSPAATHASIA